MSYAMLHHDNRSKNAVNQIKEAHSPPTESVSGSEDGLAMNMTEQGNLKENLELKDWTGIHSRSKYLDSAFDPDFEDSHSDDEEKFTSLPRSRRASTSTLHSFMLYTPDEERSVIRKFDRRLVLFVALLYMLSFLDRSSKSLRPIHSSVLTSGKISEMRGLPVCQRIYI